MKNNLGLDNDLDMIMGSLILAWNGFLSRAEVKLPTTINISDSEMFK
jgi:hypothetical protein